MYQSFSCQHDGLMCDSLHCIILNGIIIVSVRRPGVMRSRRIAHENQLEFYNHQENTVSLWAWGSGQRCHTASEQRIELVVNKHLYRKMIDTPCREVRDTGFNPPEDWTL